MRSSQTQSQMDNDFEASHWAQYTVFISKLIRMSYHFLFTPIWNQI